MTMLVASIGVADVVDAAKLVGQASSDGADAVELRIDALAESSQELITLPGAGHPETWIITCRSRGEGGASDQSPDERLLLSMRTANQLAAHIDFEFDDWRTLSEERRGALRDLLARQEPPRRLILSKHDFAGMPDDLPALLVEMLECSDQAIAKVAYTPHDICDTFPALDAMHRHGAESVVIAMGEVGEWCRVLARKLGAFASYASLSRDAATAPGQLTVCDMVSQYRWPMIDEATRIFGVLGDPVKHSLSPLIFNRWFDDAGINAVYLPLLVAREGNCVHRFLDQCMERPFLNMEGFSVTLPHKHSAASWVGDGADRPVKTIGAANTLVLGDGPPRAYNTDCHAAVDSLIAALGCARGDLLNLPIDILGCGGAAHAITAGLSTLGCRITVFGRTPGKTRSLADRFSCDARSWADRTARVGELLINTTSVGLWPSVDASPMPADSLGHCRLVFDVIYNPLETALLKDARAAGAGTLNGLDMFVRQASMQFELWMGREPNRETARRAVATEIGRLAGPQAPSDL